MNILMALSETDESYDHQVMISFIKSLAFPKAELTLLHVVQIFSPLGLPRTPLGSDAATFYHLRRMEISGQLLLDRARDYALTAGFKPQTQLLEGSGGREIIEYAIQTNTRVITIRGKTLDKKRRVAAGDITHKLITNGTQSVFVVKGHFDHATPIVAVWATDFSSYSTKCRKMFLNMKPRGLTRLIILTVMPEPIVGPSMILDAPEQECILAIRQRVVAKLQTEVEEFSQLTCPTISRLETGNTNDVIERVMKEEHANLLIMGAQGHGFLQRAAVGSVSYFQALHESYSVLVLRH